MVSPQSLDQLDPVAAWQSWRPTPADPWSRKWAAHLCRRAGFGANRAELLEAEKLGHEGTLELLMHGRESGDYSQDSVDDGGRLAVSKSDSEDRLRGWWLYAMLHSPHPLREKMTLFWHNHFATSIAKVQRADWMLEQNRLLRAHSLGKFGPFLQAISKDQAMLIWLDSNSNVKEHPNENYAREVMELFSLGVGNYTEKDIREAARAFTGWHAGTNSFQFVAAQHDYGVKTFHGQTGNWDGGDVVRIVLEQPAAARFLVRKLYQYLISETALPPNAFIEPLCVQFRKSDYDIAGLVRTMLASRHFYSEHAFRQRIKSPTEYVVGAVRAVFRRYDDGDPEYRPLHHEKLVAYVSAMGQRLFAPPNVKGWPGGRAWLNTSTMLERDNFAAALATGSLWLPPRNPAPTVSVGKKDRDGIRPKEPRPEPPAIVSDGPPPPKAFDPARLLQEEGISTPADIVRAILALYAPGGVRPEAEEKLSTFLGEGKPSGERLHQRVREAVHAVMSMPEYQLA